MNFTIFAPFSAYILGSTLQAPPTPPQLVLVSAGSQHLKVSWGGGKRTGQSLLQYVLQYSTDGTRYVHVWNQVCACMEPGMCACMEPGMCMYGTRYVHVWNQVCACLVQSLQCFSVTTPLATPLRYPPFCHTSKIPQGVRGNRAHSSLKQAPSCNKVLLESSCIV